MEEKCKKCILEHKNTIDLIKKYEEKLKKVSKTLDKE